MNEARPLAVTPGEPAGIGPECLLRHCESHGTEGLVAVADPALLRDTARRFDLGLEVREWQPGAPLPHAALACLPVPPSGDAQLDRLAARLQEQAGRRDDELRRQQERRRSARIHSPLSGAGVAFAPSRSVAGSKVREAELMQ